MDRKVQLGLNAALEQFKSVSGFNTAQLNQKITSILDGDEAFMKKVSQLDAAIDEEPSVEILREVLFDLLLINFFAEDVKKLEEDYLDSPEWEAIEDDTLDRGTELLNLLLYLKECDDEDIEPELEDYLKEFLLVEEDEFQDEHRIYEDIIANQILAESDVEEIAKVANELDISSEMKELFYPVMSFFADPDPSAETLQAYIDNSQNAQFDAPVYALLTAFNH